MTVFHRLDRVRRVANGSSGAASQREHNEMPQREACQRQVTPERSGGPHRPRDRWLVQSTARNSVRCLSAWRSNKLALLPSASGATRRAHAVPAHPCEPRPTRPTRRRGALPEGLPTTPLGGCPHTKDGRHLRQGRDAGRVAQGGRRRPTNRQPQAQLVNIRGHRVGVGRRRQ